MTSIDTPTLLRDLTFSQLSDWVADLGLPPFRARQIFAWVHGRGATSFSTMTDLAKDLRARLADEADLTPLGLDTVQASSDGTRKMRLRCADDRFIESVLIPDRDKVTQCVSCQVGCTLGCRFCATARMGRVRSLAPGEIVDQIYRGRAHLEENERVSNLVFMGMGEPMNNLDAVLRAVDILCTDIGANFSPRRITVSTAGVVPGIEELGRRNPAVGLAVSLNATTDEVRDRIMPINRRYPLKALLAALQRYPLPRRRRITIEYVLLGGLNDSDADARMLPRLLHGLKVKINLIPFNPLSDTSGLSRPQPDTVERFADSLRQKGLNTHVRRSRGQDIAAACGQLAAKARTGKPL